MEGVLPVVKGRFGDSNSCDSGLRGGDQICRRCVPPSQRGALESIEAGEAMLSNHPK